MRLRKLSLLTATASPERLTPPDLRHTAVSLAISAGVNVKVAQRVVGRRYWSEAMCLDVRGELFQDDLDRVAERMDQERRRLLRR